jgi:hypothetical protein
MDDNKLNNKEKKAWKAPIIFPLNIKRTESGEYYARTENEYGDIDTLPS